MFYLFIYLLFNLISANTQVQSTHHAALISNAPTFGIKPEISVAQLCEDMGINSNMLYSCYCVKRYGVVIYINCPNYQENIVILTENIKKIQFAFGHLPIDKARYKWVSYNIKKLHDRMILFECKEKGNIMRKEYMPTMDGIVEVPVRQADLCFKIIPKLPPGCMAHQTLNCLCISLMDSPQPCKCLYHSTQGGKRLLVFKCKFSKHQALVETIRSYYEKASMIEMNSSTIRFYIQSPISVASFKVCNDTSILQTSYTETYIDMKLLANATLCMTMAKTMSALKRSVKQLANNNKLIVKRDEANINIKPPFGQDLKLNSLQVRIKRSEVQNLSHEENKNSLLDTSLFALGIGTGIQGVIFIMAAIYKYQKRFGITHLTSS